MSLKANLGGRMASHSSGRFHCKRITIECVSPRFYKTNFDDNKTKN